MQFRYLRFFAVLTALLAIPLQAWGPHPEIIDAAMAALPAEDHARMVRLLGDQIRQLRFLVWMGDFGNQYVSWNETWNGGNARDASVQFYANDYLIFPKAPRLYRHECPDVTGTFAPFFLRALQALQTETPNNAVRWIGSLLHYTTDAGSPPHAAGISGDTHSKMENWIQGSAISNAGYQPKLLGSTADTAVQGFEQRMAGLITFSKSRAERLGPFIASGDRPGAEPIVLESADETARVTADLLHTLFSLAEREPDALKDKGASELEASMSAPALEGLKSMPAKLMILGTTYSTMSEPVTFDQGSYRGVFLLHNLPSGAYRAVVSRVGDRPIFIDRLVLSPRSRSHFDWKLEADSLAGNLVRNSDFQVRWTGSSPDNWRFDKQSEAWVSDNVQVHGGLKYRFEASRLTHASAVIQLCWYKNHWQPAADAVALGTGSGHIAIELVAPENAQYVRILIGTTEDPARVLKHVALVQFAE